MRLLYHTIPLISTQYNDLCVYYNDLYVYYPLISHTNFIVIKINC